MMLPDFLLVVARNVLGFVGRRSGGQATHFSRCGRGGVITDAMRLMALDAARFRSDGGGRGCVRKARSTGSDAFTSSKVEN